MIKGKSKYTKEILEPMVLISKTQSELLRNLGMRTGGSNFKFIMDKVIYFNIDYSHFDYGLPKRIILLKERKIKTAEEIFTTNSSYSRQGLKKRLFKDGIKTRECEMCGQGEEWQGKKMSLILDHINGVHDDNRIVNLRIVCANCNATLDTHAGKNVKKRAKKYYCKCGENICKASKECIECYNINRRITIRPEKNVMIKEVGEIGYCATGRKYGVSDNTIRKWLKYEEVV